MNSTYEQHAVTPAIWCETCSQLAPIDQWRRKIYRTRVVAGRNIVGFVSTYEHRPCRAFTAVLVSEDRDRSFKTDLT